MNHLQNIRRIHLIGICGTAMASLAGMLKESGFEVRGSDHNVYPPMSTELARLGIQLFSGFDAKNLDVRPDLVIIGNALSRGNPEVERVLDERIHYCSLPEAVRELFIRGHSSIVVTGTHGKTTTTSMLAWIFECAGLKPNFLIGGIAQNFHKSYQLGGGAHFIIEGDEYDTAFFDKGPKFLHYLPGSVLLNNVEYDHADIYPSIDAVKLSFRRLINIVPRNGSLIANANDPVVVELSRAAFCKVIFFGVTTVSAKRGESPDEDRMGYIARDIRINSEGIEFSVFESGKQLSEFRIPLFGDFNVSNALGAIVTATRFGIDIPVIQKALESFRSVRRRMEIRGSVAGVTVIDDFAHHPTAIQQTVKAVRSRFPGARLWAVVEPRSATMRRRVSEAELLRAFTGADEIVIADVYAPEKLPPGQRLSSERVVEGLKGLGKSARFLPNADAIVETCGPMARAGDVFVVFSNGGFDNIHEKLLEALKKRSHHA
ncbi:MAG TPA: UDP-N-acetylmuramate:L-alanyl-gamma-D-glutamyl-meso-diaminopimelate ligase [Nitrospirota bacterium]